MRRQVLICLAEHESKENSLSWMRFSIKAMFQLEAESTKLLCVVNPSTFLHPFCCRFSFTSNHEENRSISTVKLIVDEVSLIVILNAIMMNDPSSLTLTNLFPSLITDRLKMVEFLIEPQVFISVTAEFSVKITRMSDVSIKPSPLPERSPSKRWLTNHQECKKYAKSLHCCSNVSTFLKKNRTQRERISTNQQVRKQTENNNKNLLLRSLRTR